MPDLTAAQVFRDFVTDGVPSSGANKPKKADIRSLLRGYEDIIASFTSNGGLIYSSVAALNADLAHPANTMAWVIGDPVAANNGVYGKVGASGTGSWTRRYDLPFSFIIASDVGAGTPNAIQATTAIPVSESALILLNIAKTNTGSPVTVSYNGGAPLTIKTAAGFDIENGGLPSGMRTAGIISGSTFRLLTDNVASTLLAAMQAEVALAEAARAGAEVARNEAETQAGIAAGHAATAAGEAMAAQEAAADAADLVEAATSGFTGFDDDQAYDFGHITDATTYFDRDWGSITDPA